MTKHQPDASRSVHPSRKFLWLAIIITLLAGAYTAGWFALAGRLEDRLPLLLRQAASQSAQSECKNAAIQGYPLSMGISCQSTIIELPRHGINITTGGLSSSVPVYNPRRIISDFEGPVIVTGPNDLAIQLDWETLHTDVVIAKDGLEWGLTEGKHVSVSIDGQMLSFRINTEIGHFHAQAQRNNADLELTVQAKDFVSPIALDASTISFDATIVEGAQLTTIGPAPSLRGKALQLQTLDVVLAEGGKFKLSGKLDILPDGRANGDFRIQLTDIEAIGTALGELQPELGDQIVRFGPTLTALDIEPDDGSDTITLPLSVRNSNIFIGMLPLGTLPIIK